MRSNNLIALLWAVIFSVGTTCSDPMSARLGLIEPRNTLGHFTVPENIVVDTEHVFTCSFEGDVRMTSLEVGFPEVGPVIQATGGFPCFGMARVGNLLFVGDSSGKLSEFLVTPQGLRFSRDAHFMSISDIKFHGGYLYLAMVQGNLDIETSGTLWLGQYNPDDIAIEVDPVTLLATGRVFGEGNFPGYGFARCFDIASGAEFPPVRGPVDLFGVPQTPDITVTGGKTYFTTPGCCGAGVSTLDPLSGTLQAFYSVWTANTVVGYGAWVFVGTEAGYVHLGVTSSPVKEAHSLDLRTETGHLGAEDIEIRGMVYDPIRKVLIGVSSGGNQNNPPGSLPTVFFIRFSPPL